MRTYISMLRGINVSGHNMIRMQDLIKLYESLGFKNVKTYVQSGNVIFDSFLGDWFKIQKRIELKIKELFDFDVKVIIRTPSELKQVISKNPFIKRKGIDKTRLYISFLSGKPNPAMLKELKVNKKDSEEFLILGKEIYLYLPEGYGNSKLQIGIFEKKLKLDATARNWKTVNALYVMAQNA